MRYLSVGALAGLLIAACLVQGYVEAPYTLGRVLHESSQICLVEVAKLDKDKGLIIYKKVKDLKGNYPEAELKHNIGKRGFHAREWQTVLGWAEVGKKAVFFSNGGASLTCIGTYWYQCYKEGPWWGMTHAEPFMLRTYCGDAEKLGEAVTALLQGKEVVVPCMDDGGNRQVLHERKGKMQLLKASLKLKDYNPKRDFVAWGGDPVDIPQYRTVILLNEGADGWKFLPASKVAKGSNSWITPSFNDGTWVKGKAPIGYGEDEIPKRKGTVISEKGQPFVFRHSFNVPADLLKQKDVTFRLNVASDDSATVYLNGQLADQDPVADHEFAYWNREVDLKKELLVPGKNVIAAHVKNGAHSSDLYLDIQVTALVLLPKKTSTTVAKQPAIQKPASSLAEYKEAIPGAVKIDKGKREITIPCKVAPRKLPNLKEIYPIEVFATWPTPRGQKAHETVVVFDNIKPLAIHKALEQLGLKPGQPALGEGQASGPEVEIFLELKQDGKPKRVPINQTMVDAKSNKPLPAVKWHFTGSNLRQPDPEKDDYVYGANVTGTLITVFPVTNDCVIQSGLTLKEEKSLRLEVNKGLLPSEGSPVQLILKAR